MVAGPYIEKRQWAPLLLASVKVASWGLFIPIMYNYMHWAGLGISQTVYKTSNCEIASVAQMAAGSIVPCHREARPHPLLASPHMHFLPSMYGRPVSPQPCL